MDARTLTAHKSSNKNLAMLETLDSPTNETTQQAYRLLTIKHFPHYYPNIQITLSSQTDETLSADRSKKDWVEIFHACEKIDYKNFDKRLIQLFRIVKEGDLEELKKYEIAFKDMETFDTPTPSVYKHDNRLSICEWALKFHHQHILDYLYVNVFLRNKEKEGQTNRYLILLNQIDKLKKYLHSSPSVETHRLFAFSSLYLNIEAMSVLLQTNKPGAYSILYLKQAIQAENLPMIKLLEAHGASAYDTFNEGFKWDEVGLPYFSRVNYYGFQEALKGTNLDIVKHFIAQKRFEEVDKSDLLSICSTPIARILFYRLSKYPAIKLHQLFQSLCEKHTDLALEAIEKGVVDRHSALFFATFADNGELVTHLLKHKDVDPNRTTHNVAMCKQFASDISPLEFCVTSNRPTLLNALTSLIASPILSISIVKKEQVNAKAQLDYVMLIYNSPSTSGEDTSHRMMSLYVDKYQKAFNLLDHKLKELEQRSAAVMEVKISSKVDAINPTATVERESALSDLPAQKPPKIIFGSAQAITALSTLSVMRHRSSAAPRVNDSSQVTKAISMRSRLS